jgi:hypothetical protein
VVTKTVKWRRWTGYRSDLVRAAKMAAEEIAAWTGVASSIEGSVEYRGDLSEKFEGLADFEALTPETLRG